MGLRCRNPSRHLSQLKARQYLWLKSQVVKHFAVLNMFFMGYLKRPSLHKKKSNIKVDSWHPAVGLRCRNPPRHLSQLKARQYLWLKSQVVKNFAVLNMFFMGYLKGPPLHNFFFQISKLIFDTLLWAWGAETHLGTYVSKRPRKYLWLKPQVVKNFAFLNIFFMEYL